MVGRFRLRMEGSRVRPLWRTWSGNGEAMRLQRRICLMVGWRSITGQLSRRIGLKCWRLREAGQSACVVSALGVLEVAFIGFRSRVRLILTD
jgi:hypothetical protein